MTARGSNLGINKKRNSEYHSNLGGITVGIALHDPTRMSTTVLGL